MKSLWDGVGKADREGRLVCIQDNSCGSDSAEIENAAAAATATAAAAAVCVCV